MSSITSGPSSDKKSQPLTLKSQVAPTPESSFISPQLFNADPSLLSPKDIIRLQRTIGNQATQRLLRSDGTTSHLSASRSLQRNFVSQKAPELPTPAGAVKKATGMRAKFPKAVGPVDEEIARPEEVTAEIDEDTLRTDKRAVDGILSNVTGMARDEQAVLKGSSTDKYYDAGHLIADELIGGAKDSFEYFNLAPQHAQFNQKSYRIFESKVKRWARWGNTITLTAKLQYESPFEVTVGSLIDSGLIEEDKLNTLKKAKSKADKNTKIKIDRRVPSSWSLSAAMEDYKKDESLAAKKPKQKRDDYSKRDDYADPLATNIGFSKGHQFNIPKATKGTMPDPKDNKKTVPTKSKAIEGKQWIPSDILEYNELVEYVQKTYPKMTENLIKQVVNSTGVIKVDISQLDELLDVKATPLEEILTAYKTDTKKEKPKVLSEQVTYYTEAKAWMEKKKLGLEVKREKDKKELTSAVGHEARLNATLAYLTTLKEIRKSELSENKLLLALNMTYAEIFKNSQEKKAKKEKAKKEAEEKRAEKKPSTTDLSAEEAPTKRSKTDPSMNLDD